MISQEKKKEASLIALRKELATYCPISDQTWEKFTQICAFRNLKKSQFFTRQGEIPESMAFVYSGLLRTYITDLKGNEYNKIFFQENNLIGSMVALLTNSPSNFAIESLEDSDLLQINFKEYRNLLKTQDDLKWFQILYLEKNWLIEKEKREISLVQENATERYLIFKETYPTLEQRIPQFHIASHLGVTPTQLSRIRKALPTNQKN